MAIGASAQTPPPAPGLISAWLSAPGLSSAPAPYQFLQLDGVQAAAKTERRRLFEEFDQLAYRLEGGGYIGLVETLGEWRETLSGISSFRSPGYWDTAWLLSHPYEVPPLDRVSAIGACAAPDWVEVWDEHGVHRIHWKDASDLASLVADTELRSGGDGRVLVVRPNGVFRSYGIEAWNFHDTQLAPGSRVVAALPLGGDVFPFIQRAIARLLSHTPSGENCMQVTLDATDD